MRLYYFIVIIHSFTKAIVLDMLCEQIFKNASVIEGLSTTLKMMLYHICTGIF